MSKTIDPIKLSQFLKPFEFLAGLDEHKGPLEALAVYQKYYAYTSKQPIPEEVAKKILKRYENILSELNAEYQELKNKVEKT